MQQMQVSKYESANTTVLIYIKEDRIVTTNVHLYSLIILSYSNIVQHGYKIQIPQNRHNMTLLSFHILRSLPNDALQ